MILEETDKLYLYDSYEDAYLIDKESSDILFTDSFYGGPSCALIDPNNKYAIVAGKHLTLWDCYEGNNKLTKFETEQFCWIERLRLINEDTIQILLDPWFQYSAIWELTVSNKSLFKISDFMKYKNLPYTDNIVW